MAASVRRHPALLMVPVLTVLVAAVVAVLGSTAQAAETPRRGGVDRKSTRLNSSHIQKSRMPSSA